MPKRTDISSILIVGASLFSFATEAPAQAQVPNTGWLLRHDATGVLVLSRHLDSLTIDYRAGAASGPDRLHVEARPCSKTVPSWTQDNDVTPTGETVGDVRASVLGAVGDAVQNAGAACTLPDDLGFEAAYAQFRQLKK